MPWNFFSFILGFNAGEQSGGRLITQARQAIADRQLLRSKRAEYFIDMFDKKISVIIADHDNKILWFIKNSTKLLPLKYHTPKIDGVTCNGYFNNIYYDKSTGDIVSDLGKTVVVAKTNIKSSATDNMFILNNSKNPEDRIADIKDKNGRVISQRPYKTSDYSEIDRAAIGALVFYKQKQFFKGEVFLNSGGLTLDDKGQCPLQKLFEDGFEPYDIVIIS